MKDSKTIRTFIAIEISKELHKFFYNLHNDMCKIPANIKWINPDSIHLTLKFLGNIPKSQVEGVNISLQNSVKDSKKFNLISYGKGAFPSLKKPRVFWVGLKEKESGALIRIHNMVEKEMEKIGFVREKRKYNLHLTVGRVRGPLNLELVTKNFMNFPVPEIEFSVDRVLVMKSDLTPKGAIYSIQKAVDLS